MDVEVCVVELVGFEIKVVEVWLAEVELLEDAALAASPVMLK